MKSHIVIDGNAFYEVDEECMQRREEQQKKWKNINFERKPCSGQNSRCGRRKPGL